MTKFYKSKYTLINGKIVENSGIYVNKGIIVKPEYDCELIDCGNAMITPGFINFHAHLQYTELKNKFSNTDEINFTDWITGLIKQYFFWNSEKKLKSLQNGLKETVKSGVTCVVNLGIESEFIEAFEDSGIKSYVFLETFADTEKRVDKEFKTLMKHLEKYNTANVGISPHAPYNVHPLLWEKLSEVDVLVHTHLAESVDEMKWMRGEPSGIEKMHKFVRFKTFPPYEVFRAIEPFGEKLIAAHCCQLGFDDVKHLNIAHCPRSNMLLHGKTLELGGFAPKVGIGTDSKYSNYDLNILHEAKFLRDRSNLSFIEIMNMLTINAARMLKMDKSTGSLETGKDADFLVFKIEENQGFADILDVDGPDEAYVQGKRLF